MWIRIQEGKNDPQKLKTCSEVLDVHFYGQKASPVAWTSFTELKTKGIFSVVKF
jgi:hypothetical protein